MAIKIPRCRKYTCVICKKETGPCAAYFINAADAATHITARDTGRRKVGQRYTVLFTVNTECGSK